MNALRRLIALVLLLASLGSFTKTQVPAPTPAPTKVRPSPTPSRTASVTPSATLTASPTEAATATETAIATATQTEAATATSTADATGTATATEIPEPTQTAGPIAPYPGAPACAEHSFSAFHTLWNSRAGCHHDHEHGHNAFIPEALAMFPHIDVRAFLGGVEVGHTNPSSPVENTDKHGGNKWNVQFIHPEDCAGFEGAETGVNGSLIQYHGFGNQAIELEARIHTTVAFLRQCRSDDPTDYGYVAINQAQDYGQRIIPYQGTVVAYPNQPDPAYPSARGPYLSTDCIGPVIQCRESLDYVQTRFPHLAMVSNWTSKPTGAGTSTTPGLFQLLWNLIDIYRAFDWTDQTHPFTWLWLCSSDGGVTYDPAGCRYNNTTTQVREIAGEIPATWDNLIGWDTEPEVGRVTIDGFVNQDGDPTAVCEAPGTVCKPFWAHRAFTGSYGSVLLYTTNKGVNIVPGREGDLYFCGPVVCDKSAPGAVPSGWIGPSN